MKKLLIVCGPTGVGKTSLTYKLTEIFDSEVLTVDSRQIFKGLNYLTGKDLPNNSKLIYSNLSFGAFKIPYFKYKNTKVWGTDLIDLDIEPNSSLYEKFGSLILGEIYQRNRLPIVSGGTGMYISALLGQYETLHIPRNGELRQILESMSVEQLQERLMDLDLTKIGQMNDSDKKNKRRLVRAIEVSEWTKQHETPIITPVNYNIYWLGLYANRTKLEEKIRHRIIERFENAKLEYEKYLNNCNKLSPQTFTTLGINHLKSYLEKNIDYETAVSNWQKDELNYAKRQLIWFKKNPQINWFDVDSINYFENVVSQVSQWYTKE